MQRDLLIAGDLDLALAAGAGSSASNCRCLAFGRSSSPVCACSSSMRSVSSTMRSIRARLSSSSSIEPLTLPLPAPSLSTWHMHNIFSFTIDNFYGARDFDIALSRWACCSESWLDCGTMCTLSIDFNWWFDAIIQYWLWKNKKKLISNNNWASNQIQIK